MTDRERTGVTGLDSILGGGLPEGSTILVIGEPGTGKSIFCDQFINAGLEDGENGLIITLDDLPDDVAERAMDFGWDLRGYEDSFLFMDAYSWRLGEDVEGKYTIQGPSDLNQLNMTLTDALRDLGDGRPRIGIDSVSTLVLYTNINSAVKFLQVVSAKSKAKDGVLLLTIEEGVHDEKEVSTLNYVADGVIRFKQEGGDRYMSVSRMSKTSHGRDWHQFEVTDDGIVFVD